jgi:hypothetical protein
VLRGSWGRRKPWLGQGLHTKAVSATELEVKMSRELTELKAHHRQVHILAKEMINALRRIQPRLARAASMHWDGNVEEDFNTLLSILPDLEAALGESELAGYVGPAPLSPEGERIRAMSRAMRGQAAQAFALLQPLAGKKPDGG